LPQDNWQWTIDRLEMPLEIRLIKELEELTAVKNLERVVWANDDPVPVHQTLTAVKNGGIVLGAYYDSQLVGFQYSFAGFDGKEAYLCSHTLGIHPEFRSYGIGEKLKWAQREEAKKKGYRLITWTYDPLETVNAHLNIRKLGGISFRYIENCYGEMKDVLNVGVPSDRLVVHWQLESERVRGRLRQKGVAVGNVCCGEDTPLLLEVSVNENGLPVPKRRVISLAMLAGNEHFLLPVPAFYQKIKELDLNLAKTWRQTSREVFQLCIEQGFAVVDFIKEKNLSEIHYYVVGRLNTESGK
jgi:predicted GNAT superfamily acetyltransferase